jgi:hypothetical protein
MIIPGQNGPGSGVTGISVLAYGDVWRFAGSNPTSVQAILFHCAVGPPRIHVPVVPIREHNVQMLPVAVVPVPAVRAPVLPEVTRYPVHIAGMWITVFRVVHRQTTHAGKVFCGPAFGADGCWMRRPVGCEPILPIRLRRRDMARMLLGALQKCSYFCAHFVDESTWRGH